MLGTVFEHDRVVSSKQKNVRALDCVSCSKIVLSMLNHCFLPCWTLSAVFQHSTNIYSTVMSHNALHMFMNSCRYLNGHNLLSDPTSSTLILLWHFIYFLSLPVLGAGCCYSWNDWHKNKGNEGDEWIVGSACRVEWDQDCVYNFIFLTLFRLGGLQVFSLLCWNGLQ